MSDNDVKLLLGILGLAGTMLGIMIPSPKFLHRNGDNADKRQLEIERHDALLTQLAKVGEALDGNQTAIRELTQGIQHHHDAEMNFWDALVGANGIVALRKPRKPGDRRTRTRA